MPNAKRNPTDDNKENTVAAPADQHLDKALARLETAVAALEKGGVGQAGGDDARRGEIEAIRAMISEAVQILDGKPGGGEA